MTIRADYRKIAKNIKIFAAVQVGLVALLVYMAVNFQGKLRLMGRESNFMYGVVAAALLQLVLFYPIKRFAAKEADRDLLLTTRQFSTEELKGFAKQKRHGEIAKMSTLGFFIIFILAAPSDPLALSVVYYSFILTILTYFQCYSFAAKRMMRPQGA